MNVKDFKKYVHAVDKIMVAIHLDENDTLYVEANKRDAKSLIKYMTANKIKDIPAVKAKKSNVLYIGD